ncbi:hypothetical protein O0L34_g16108 [Tuta absoluta]|nr:hypothetical protein O0L34_g16108 [Tuta absoluta]
MTSPDVTSQIFTEPPVEYSSSEDPENTTGSVRDETEKVVTGLTEAAVNWENVVLNDNMGTKEKQTMNAMINQIYGEAEVLVHQVNIIIDMHKVALGFEVGRVIGLIQARYRHMMELWREVSNKEVHFGYNPKTKMWPAAWSISHLYDVKYGGQYPAMFHPRMNNYFITVYAMIFEIERDIEKLIDILLAIPRYEMHLPPITMKHSTERTTTPQEDYGDPADDQAASHPLKPSSARKRAYDAPKWVAGRASLRRGVNLDEERLKHRMREKFLLRNLGLNDSGHTPKPRFIQGWPVEETWDKIPLY